MKLKISGDKLTLASAHMLIKHDKCARLHGHNYEIEVEIEGDLDENNMVIDFGPFKTSVSSIIKELDHMVLLPENNSDLNIELDQKQYKVSTCDGKFYRFPKEDVVLVPLEATTVELLSKYLHDKLKGKYPQFNITVTMSETPTSIVSYTE
ncbi:MAG: 6-carboxytetrahydropterin synthase [Candidatus Heimdallarchaeota archaeon]|nr:6-carboxytetrahydropterin synthase [Candidatus Heimdallarchaeota archaeon]